MGKPAQRLDGPAKVTGAAKYTYDVHRPGIQSLEQRGPGRELRPADLKAQRLELLLQHAPCPGQEQGNGRFLIADRQSVGSRSATEEECGGGKRRAGYERAAAQSHRGHRPRPFLDVDISH